MTRRNLHGLTAALVITAALVFIFTESVAAAVFGLALVVAAAVTLFLARGRE